MQTTWKLSKEAEGIAANSTARFLDMDSGVDPSQTTEEAKCLASVGTQPPRCKQEQVLAVKMRQKRQDVADRMADRGRRSHLGTAFIVNDILPPCPYNALVDSCEKQDPLQLGFVMG